MRRESRAVERRLRYRVKSTSSWLALMSAVVANRSQGAGDAHDPVVAEALAGPGDLSSESTRRPACPRRASRLKQPEAGGGPSTDLSRRRDYSPHRVPRTRVPGVPRPEPRHQRQEVRRHAFRVYGTGVFDRTSGPPFDRQLYAVHCRATLSMVDPENRGEPLLAGSHRDSPMQRRLRALHSRRCHCGYRYQ